MQLHPIIQQSFVIIDQEIGEHQLTDDEYAIVRRVIHSSADFEFKELLHFSERAIAVCIDYLQQGNPIVTDVSMVAQGIKSMAQQTFQNPVINALEHSQMVLPGATRTESGVLKALEIYPNAMYVIGNAPTALLALCQTIQRRQLQAQAMEIPCVVGAPVGFVSVKESKDMLMTTDIEKIVVKGRKGGSPVAAGIVNALLYLAWEQRHR